MRGCLFFGPLVAAFLATPAFAQPVGVECPALTDVDAFPDNRKRSAPLYLDPQTGWILRDSDNLTEFALTDDAVVLFSEIARLLHENTGTQLVTVVPPPRGLFASNGTDTAAIRRAYEDLLDQLRSTGAIVPDVLAMVDGDAVAFESFYYKSDSHWTPNGALLAAQAVARALDEAGALPEQPEDPRFEIADTPLPIDRYGNLLRIVEEVCGGGLPTELIEVPEIVATQPDDLASALFGDAPTARAEDIILVGTSFTHSDDFRWADSVSLVLQHPVSNRALSGGVFQLALTAYADSALAEERPDILIWEFLHYYARFDLSKLLRDVSASVAGGCSANTQGDPIALTFTDAEWSADIQIPPGHDLIALNLPGSDLGTVEVQLRTPDRTRIVGVASRPDRIPPELRSETWSFNIAQNIDGELVATGGTANLKVKDMKLPLVGTVVTCTSD